MKKTFIFILTAIALTAISCNKNSLDIGNPAEKLTFINSDVVPSLTMVPGTPMNMTLFNPSDGDLVIKLETNVDWIFGNCEGITGLKNIYGVFLEAVDENGNPHKGIDVTRTEHGTGYIKARNRAEHKYTTDDQYTLGENPFAGNWVNYCGDGPLQLIFTIRVLGTEGTKYIDFTDILKDASTRDNTNGDTYAKGEIKAISEITSGSEKRASDMQRAWGAHYPEISSESYAKAEYVTFTLTNGVNDIDLKVWGQKRENEISRLLEYVKVGDIVEMPVTKMDKNSTEINQIHASAVLKK